MVFVFALFSDPTLAQRKKTSSRFVRELFDRSLIDLGERSEATVGIFFFSRATSGPSA